MVQGRAAAARHIASRRDGRGLRRACAEIALLRSFFAIRRVLSLDFLAVDVVTCVDSDESFSMLLRHWGGAKIV